MAVVNRGFVFLESLENEANKLLTIANEFFALQSKEQESLDISKEARLSYVITMSNINVRLYNVLAWIREMKKIDFSNLNGTTGGDKEKIIQFEEKIFDDEIYYGYLPKLMIQLAYMSNQLQSRVSRLHTEILNSQEQRPNVVIGTNWSANVLKLRAS